MRTVYQVVLNKEILSSSEDYWRCESFKDDLPSEDRELATIDEVEDDSAHCYGGL